MTKNYCLTCLILGFGTLFIIFLWLPTEQQFRRSNPINVQQGEGVDAGFLLRFYSPSTFPFGQDYAYKACLTCWFKRNWLYGVS